MSAAVKNGIDEDAVVTSRRGSPYEEGGEEAEGDATCRVCLTVRPVNRSVFDYSHEERTSVSDMISMICSIRLLQSDSLPTNICSRCFDDLKCAYMFRERCRRSEDTLNHRLLTVERSNLEIKEEPIFESIQEHVDDDNVVVPTNNSQAMLQYICTSIQDPAPNNDTNNTVNAPKDTFDNLFTCDKCNAMFKCTYDMVRHLDLHYKETHHPCTYCEYVSKTRRALINHMKMHQCKDRYLCTECDFISENGAEMKEHILSHGNGERYTCNKCNYSSLWRSDLFAHIVKVHANERKYAWIRYDYTPVKNGDVKVVIPKSESKFACHICNHVARREIELKSHVQMHKSKTKHMCHICSYVCNRRANLYAHLTTHFSERNYPCTVCSYAAKVPSELKRHMVIHDNDRKYACDLCYYTTKRKSNLVSHLLKHQDTKKHKCNVCGYMSKWKSCMIAHLGTHKNEKKFKCHLCKYTGRMKTELTRHLIRHTNVKKFVCHNCGYGTKRKSSLAVHIRKYH